MEGFIAIISFAFTLLCAWVLYKCIIGTLNTVEDVVACIKDIRRLLSNIDTYLRKGTIE